MAKYYPKLGNWTAFLARGWKTEYQFKVLNALGLPGGCRSLELSNRLRPPGTNYHRLQFKYYNPFDKTFKAHLNKKVITTITSSESSLYFERKCL